MIDIEAHGTGDVTEGRLGCSAGTTPSDGPRPTPSCPPSATGDALPWDAEQLCSALAASGIGVWSLDLLTGRWAMSEGARAMLGLAPRGIGEDRLRGSEPLERLSILDGGGFAPEPDGPDGATPGRGLPDGVFRVSRVDTGAQAWMASASCIVRDRDGRPTRVVGTLRDVTALRRSEMERDANERRLDAALTIGRMVVWDLDVATGLVTRSANAEDVLGSRHEPIVDFFARIHPEDRHKVDWETSPNPVPPAGDFRFRYRHPDGREMWLETSAMKLAMGGERGHIVGITTDVTERCRAEERLVHAAHHDPLTGLLNRKAWTAVVESLTGAPRPARLCMLLFDVDRFKTINDSLGHDAGDAVLTAIAQRLSTAVPGVTAAARLGGDEFAALLAAAEGRDVAQLVEACMGALTQPVRVGGRDVPISVSAGVARFPEDGVTAADLAKNADLALYAAKAGGRKRACRFTPAMRAAFDARLSTLSAFRDGLATGAVVPFYQPKVDLATGRLVGFEALARWLHPARGVLTPAVFAPVFEDAELARRLGLVMRAAVLADMRQWLDRGLPVGRVAVNCAASEFADGTFGEVVLREIEAAGVPPARFEIEVTEGVVMDRDAAPLGCAMAALRGAGVSIALDDFGTGYASLVHLKRFPVDVIKIDRSFVAGMDDPSDAAIVGTLIAMARALGIATVAEGVETAGTAAKLLDLGCDQAQGFLFGKPMHAARVPWSVGLPRGIAAPGERRAALRRPLDTAAGGT